MTEAKNGKAPTAKEIAKQLMSDTAFNVFAAAVMPLTSLRSLELPQKPLHPIAAVSFPIVDAGVSALAAVNPETLLLPARLTLSAIAFLGLEGRTIVQTVRSLKRTPVVKTA